MSKKKILLALPTRGQVHPKSVISIIDIMKDGRYDVDFFFGWTNRGVEEARNQIAKYFLTTDADFLLTMDDDMALEGKNPLDFVELDKDIIGCPYPVIVNGLQIATYKDGKSHVGKGLEQIDEMGMGCVLIARRVLEKLQSPFSALLNKDGTWAYSEDRSFCRRSKEEGFEVWAHFDYLLSHYIDIDITKYYVQKHGGS